MAMRCDIQTSTSFTLILDLQGFAAIERALAFYKDRASLPDGDPAGELSRKFTAMLLKLSIPAVAAPSAPTLLVESPPKPSAQVCTASPATMGAGAAPVKPKAPAAPDHSPSVQSLEEVLDDMLGGT